MDGNQATEPARARGADLLAQLRTQAWANGGRLTLGPDQVSADDAALAHRFGVWISEDCTRLSLEDEDLERLGANLTTLKHADGSDRRLYASATPDAALLRYTDHTQYRSETQKAAITALMTMPPAAGLMVSMPTGSGKSMLFQAATRYWRDHEKGACAIVITPTIALAEDHRLSLRALTGLQNSRALIGTQSAGEREEILMAFRRGEVPILLLSPEAALGAQAADILEAAKPASDKSGLAARLMGVFIDEAHIVESWGRTFRPNFQRLPGLVEALRRHNPDLRTVLLSATLDGPSRRELRRAYGGPDWLEVHARAPRYDFDIALRRFKSVSERQEALHAVIDRAPRPAIVYTTLIEEADALFAALKSRGYSRIALFTGDIRGDERQRILEDWRDDRLDLVVATSAFGLGVDKSNVRSVVHACLPESASRYYQEIGRAARDGRQGYAIMLWTGSSSDRDDDEHDAAGLATGSWLTRQIAEKRWRALRETGVFPWDGATRRGELSLDAAREGLPPRTGMPNRQWNMSLLNLLQRAGAIRIEGGVEKQDSASWSVRILDPALLGDNADSTKLWDRIYALRDAEVQEAGAAFRAFRDTVRDPDEVCVLQAIYEFIEPDAFYVAPCGRCPSCRSAERAPPTSICLSGLDQAWPRGLVADAKTPPGITIVIPEDADFDRGLPALLQRLARVGIEQCIVPEEKSARSAPMVKATRARFGFVHGTDAWLTPGRAFAGVPTALFIPDYGATYFEAALARLQKLERDFPDLPLILVVNPDRTIEDRPLGQIASKLAPYRESDLDRLSDAT